MVDEFRTRKDIDKIYSMLSLISDKDEVIDLIYPIGCVFTTISDVNPRLIFKRNNGQTDWLQLDSVVVDGITVYRWRRVS